MYGSRVSRDPQDSLTSMQQVAPAQAVGQSARAYEVFTPAVERLAARYPVAASLLYLRTVESILKRGSGKQYGYTARDMQDLASLAGRVSDDDGIEGHDAFVARLQREHGRKYSFWELLKAG